MGYTSTKEAVKKQGATRADLLCPEPGGDATVWVAPTVVETPRIAKPFLKWAGGKGQLLPEIAKYYPFEQHQITKYAEPFVGGGAVLFDVLSKFDLRAVYINDANPELINTYRAIRDAVDELVALLATMQTDFYARDVACQKEYYLAQRQRFNELKADPDTATATEKAALMIFLNRTCFNGLYRVNKKGAFNVPMGNYQKPLICDEANLRAVSRKLQHVTIACGNYQKSAEFIDDQTFVYFDPPYRPLTTSASFTAYTADAFDDAAQIALAKFVDKMHARGAKILLSNSDPKNANPQDDFFDNLYANYKISRIEAARAINSRGSARGKIKELLISNF